DLPVEAVSRHGLVGPGNDRDPDPMELSKDVQVHLPERMGVLGVVPRDTETAERRLQGLRDLCEARLDSRDLLGSMSAQLRERHRGIDDDISPAEELEGLFRRGRGNVDLPN